MILITIFSVFIALFGMSGYRSCAVVGCDDRTSTRHRFPNPEKDGVRFRKWVHLSGNALLPGMESSRVYNSYRICHRHFAGDTNATNMYLKKTSLPTLYMPGKLFS